MRVCVRIRLWSVADGLYCGAYSEANMRFAEVVNGFVGKGDMVWVQDYHRESSSLLCGMSEICLC